MKRTTLSAFFLIILIIVLLFGCGAGVWYLVRRFWQGFEQPEQEITLSKVILNDSDDGKIRDYDILSDKQLLLYIGEKPSGTNTAITLYLLNLEAKSKQKIITVTETESRSYKLELTESGYIFVVNSNLSKIAYYDKDSNKSELLEIVDSLTFLNKNFFDSSANERENIKKDMYNKCDEVMNEATSITSIKISKYLPYKVIYLLKLPDNKLKALIEEQCLPTDKSYESFTTKYKDKINYDSAIEAKTLNQYGKGDPQNFVAEEYNFKMKSIFYLCLDTCSRAANHIYWNDKYFFARADSNFREPQFDYKGSPIFLMNDELFTLK